MKMFRLRAAVLKMGVVALMFGAFTANAAVVRIQNAQYISDNDTVLVKGKLSKSVSQVHVLDANSDRYLGSVDTFASGRMFRVYMYEGSERLVPCKVRIQTKHPQGTPGPRRSAPNELAESDVRHAPARCFGGR